MPPVDRASLPDRVFQELAAAVLSGEYGAGEPLPPQRALAAELGVNLASLREGLKRLEQLRLVEIRHGDATRVADWRSTSGLDVLVHAASTEPHVIGAVFEARRLLLREAARLAASRRSDEQARELGVLARRMEGAGDPAEEQALDLAFFAGVIEASSNLVFKLIVNSIRAFYVERLDFFRAMVGSGGELHPHYAAAARAISDGDGDAAAAAVERIAAAQEARMAGAPADSAAGEARG